MATALANTPLGLFDNPSYLATLAPMQVLRSAMTHTVNTKKVPFTVPDRLNQGDWNKYKEIVSSEPMRTAFVTMLQQAGYKVTTFQDSSYSTQQSEIWGHDNTFTTWRIRVEEY